jgi:predicted Na+-dependent transporter
VVPQYALALLLLSGTATGVSAPFFTSVAEGNVVLALVMAAATSLILPLSLPLMCQVMAGQSFDFDLIGMALLLSAIIFLPLATVWLGRLVVPRALNQLGKVSFPLSLGVMSVINFGAFGRYADYLTGNPAQILMSTLISFALLIVQGVLGWLVFRNGDSPDRLAAVGSVIWINNVLVIVLGTELGDPLTSVLAAIYMIPLFASIPLLGPLDRVISGKRK